MKNKSLRIKLTDSAVQKRRLTAGTIQWVRDTHTLGFGLKVSPNGRKSFFVERRAANNGSAKRRTLGTYPEYGVEEARTKAIAWLRKLSEGIDPKEAERLKALKEEEVTKADSKEAYKEKLLNMTVFQLLEDVYLSGDERFKRTRAKKQTTVKDVRDVWKAHLKEWRHQPIRALTPRKIKDLYQDIAINKNAPSQAEKFRKYLNASFNVLINEWNRDYPDDELFAGNINPAEVGLKGEKVKAPIKEKVWLSQRQLSKITPYFDMTTSKTFEQIRSKQFYAMLIQYGLRKSELLGLMWEDVDFADGEGTGTLTFRDTKKGNDHIIPISKVMHYALKDYLNLTKTFYPDDDLGFVFRNDENTGPLTTNPRYALRQLNKLAGVSFSCHDLRRTFNKWIESPDILNQDKVVAERLLNQEPSGVNERFYQDIKPTDYRFLYDQLWWYLVTGAVLPKQFEPLTYWQMVHVISEVNDKLKDEPKLRTIQADPLEGVSPEIREMAQHYFSTSKDVKRLT